MKQKGRQVQGQEQVGIASVSSNHTNNAILSKNSPPLQHCRTQHTLPAPHQT